MWKSIKKFFKWIADHTGISWIAKKISSGWNSVKNWWSGNKVSQASNTNPPKNEMPRKPDISANGLSITNEPNPAEPKPEPVASIVEDKGELVLFVESADKLKYSAYIRCDAGIFQITCGKLIEANSNGTFLNIESLASQDGKDSSSELEGMKNMLGLNEKHAVVSITQISQDPITVPKTVEDGNTPNSETTSPGAQPHTTGNDRPVNA